MNNGIKTEGKVIDVSLDYNIRNERYYYPIVRFTLEDGTWVTEKYSDGSSPASFEKGEKVELMYDPKEPASYIILSNKTKHTDKLFLVIGMLMIIYSLYHLMK